MTNIHTEIKKVVQGAGGSPQSSDAAATEIMHMFRVSLPEPELLPEELRQEGNPNHNPYHNYVAMDGRLTGPGNGLVEFAFRVLMDACYLNAVKHGWWESEERNFGELIALIHSEASEALEAYRDGDDMTRIDFEEQQDAHGNLLEAHDGSPMPAKPLGIASELADIVIRVADMAKGLEIPLADAIIEKHAFNYSRPYRHGGKNA